MKIQRVILTMLVAFCLLFTVVSPAAAMPPIPASYFGTVKVNDASIPVGMVISAWINGVQYAYSTATACTFEGQPATCYSLIVAGDDPETDPIEGGNTGDVIHFHIGSLVADQTVTWRSEANLKLDLTATDLTIPDITITGALAPFISLAGHPSLAQSYTVSGINLDDPIVITAPANFEISLDSNAGFTTSLSLNPTAGLVNGTVIYVRFNRATIGSSNGNITHSSAFAPTRSLPVSGAAWTYQIFLPMLVNLSS